MRRGVVSSEQFTGWAFVTPAAVIIGLCASLLAGFLATSSQLGVPSSTRTDAASVACDAAAVGHAC